jgi:hypothetical protein
MNDDIMEENVNAYRNKKKSKKWEKKFENKSLKIACIKKKLVITWKIVFVLEIFIMSMIIQKLILKIHKSCVVSFVINNM